MLPEDAHQKGKESFMFCPTTDQHLPAPPKKIGTLSLAYSFNAAGTLVGSLLLALICLATDFTLFALISASRRTGAKSYEVHMLGSAMPACGCAWGVCGVGRWS